MYCPRLQNQILRNSMFGNTLSEVMDLQKDKFPFRKLPWIQTTLSEHVRDEINISYAQ